jgi:hypothetical protein
MYGALAPLAKLPPIGNLFQGFDGLTPMFTSPEFIKMAKAIAKAGEETVKFRKTIGDSGEELAQLGFPRWLIWEAEASGALLLTWYQAF